MRVVLLTNQASATLDSDLQAVKIVSSACRSCDQSQKNEVASIVQQAQKLTWMKSVLAYSENLYKQSIKLTQVFLAKQNTALFEDSDVYFQLFKQFKIFIVKSIIFTTITEIHISQIFEEVMNSLQAKKWIETINKKMQQNHK